MCRRGASCRYFHGGHPAAEECGDFKRGSCGRGERCRFVHPGGAGT
eukprot:gene56990-biopygen38678